MSHLNEEEIAYELSRLPGWSLAGGAVEKTFDRGDFAAAAAFLCEIAATADEMGHHPDARVCRGKVTLSLTTHDAGGLTGLDFELATRIDEIA